MKQIKNILTISVIVFLGGFVANAQTITVQIPQAQQCCTLADCDSDGVPDNMDKCMCVAGVAALQGCPVPAGPTGTAYNFECDHANTAIVDVTLPDGSVWMDRNMGALHAAYDDLDLFAAGCVYQYGRKPDGHQRTVYYQPKNWLNGYPTASNTLYDSGGPYMIDNGASTTPSAGNSGITGYIDGAVSQSSIWTKWTQTYNYTAGSPGDLTPGSPTASDIPARTDIGTAQGYSNFSWYSDITTYPLNETLPKLWGGEILPNNLTPTDPYSYVGIIATPLEIPYVYDAYKPMSAVQWGDELNPVCPTGYHVPTAQEWISAMHSVNAATPANKNWGETMLHLFVGDGGAVYWTSSQISGTFDIVSNHDAVGFLTDGTQHNRDLAGIGNIDPVSYSVVSGSYTPQCTDNLHVRCKKNLPALPIELH